ncbi:FAD-dependent monooxygenase [Plantactinospora sp. S1510]|uniref:FAD-dependent monooxygenase n=1 Tax=Plantactinospora alkalitolerans TaxID=2789879 RepID=A0ABS0H7M6_9ACTN|nr:FAD-dependent monooxygenase [Plantactinospora alkalitolerans]
MAIVGGGIGGLAAAAALARAGLRPRVYEQTSRLTEVGAGLQLAPNATRLLDRLGLGRYLAEVAVQPSAVELRRWDDGALLDRTELGARCEQLYGARYYTVHRADLHDGLRRTLDPDLLRLGFRCTGLTAGQDRAVLRFEDRDDVTADVVVGADGIRSVIRATLVADRPRYSGQLVYRGLVPARMVPFQRADPRVLIWVGPGRHCVCYPVRRGELVSFAATVPSDDPLGESWRAEGRIENLAEAYRGWTDEVGQLFTAADRVHRWALHDRDATDRWGAGPLTLLGDAAHPMLPFMAQGANQAIEDAATLAACLRPEVSTQALRRYEELRRPRTAEVQALSRANARVLHRPAAGVGNAQDIRNKRWLFGYDAELAAAERCTVPPAPRQD